MQRDISDYDYQSTAVNLLDLYQFISNELKNREEKVSAYMKGEDAIAYNYLRDVRKDVVKLMVRMDQAFGPLEKMQQIINQYTDPENRRISSPLEKKEVVELQDQFQKQKDDSLHQQIKTLQDCRLDFLELTTSLAANKKQFLDKNALEQLLTASHHALSLQKDTPKTTLFRDIKTKLDDVIHKRGQLILDAERDLPRNPDYLIGIKVIQKINEISSKNPDEAASAKELHLALNQAKMEIKYSDNINKASLATLKKAVEHAIQEIEKSYPAVKTSNQSEINKVEQQEKSHLVEREKARQTEKKNLEQNIKKLKEKAAASPEKELNSLCEKLITSLKKNKADVSKDMASALEAVTKNKEVGTSEKFASISNILKSFEHSPPKKAQGINVKSLFGLFKPKSPEENLRAIAQRGLRDLENLDKKHSLSREAPTIGTHRR